MKLVHNIKKPYICDNAACGKAFEKNRELVNHKLSSTCNKVISHPCPNMCGKTFPTMQQLHLVHLAKSRCTHKFQCQVCPDKPYFMKKKDRDTHMATHSNKQIVSMDITIPANQNCHARLVTIHVPISSVSQGSEAQVGLEQVLAITVPEVVSLGLTAEQASGFIQTKINLIFNL